MEEIAMTTLGGIRVNKELQALDKDLKPIPGLYVTGKDVGGLFVGSYSLHSASGTTFGFAIGSGRMAVTDILVKMGKAEY
ncbi:MAG: FAD-binding protein, partial [Acidobacteria bacterium]|nr:FAD-binding protein [Acidobacteriota bacterium]